MEYEEEKKHLEQIVKGVHQLQIERERQIRSEVLAKCQHTACVINRVSIAWNHPN